MRGRKEGRNTPELGVGVGGAQKDILKRPLDQPLQLANHRLGNIYN